MRAFEVDCPRCEAVAGELCEGAGGHNVPYHVERLVAAGDERGIGEMSELQDWVKTRGLERALGINGNDPRRLWLNDTVMVQSLAAPAWRRCGLLLDYGDGWVLLEVQTPLFPSVSHDPHVMKVVTTREMVFVGPGVNIHLVVRSEDEQR